MIRSCLDIQSHLSAWLDGELADDIHKSVYAHLAECSECRSYVESLQQLDVTLKQVATLQNVAASRIAGNVLAAIANDRADDEQSSKNTGDRVLHDTARTSSTAVAPTDSIAVTRETNSSGHCSDPEKRFALPFARLLSPAAAAAAGFLLAWLIFAPSSTEIAKNDKQPQPEIDVKVTAPPRIEPTLAHLVSATGKVEFRQPGQSDWSGMANTKSFNCPPGTQVRTGARVCCELETENHCTIRLNEGTELAIRSPREIELRTGQVWCSSASGVELQVDAAMASRPKSNPALCFTCPSNGSLMSEIDPMGNCRIQSASGEVSVSLGETKQQLKRGEIARFDNGQLIIETHHSDSLLATSWMQPLLVLKGHDNAELGDRVNRLLANLGRSKLQNLYEDEIRSLGEYAALPLLRFVQSVSSRTEPAQRLQAMSILADIAPSWLTGELIELLADSEPRVRIQAAVALKRLTRQTQGRGPEEWSAPLAELKDSLDRWHTWWKENVHRYEQKQTGTIPSKEKNA